MGYAPQGDFEIDGQAVRPADHPDLVDLARAGLLCNDAALTIREGASHLEGDPTEGALLTLALKAGVDADLQRKSEPRTDTIPFESEHRFMATLHHDHTGHVYAYVKGAPERVLDMCTFERRGGQARPHRYPRLAPACRGAGRQRAAGAGSGHAAA